MDPSLLYLGFRLLLVLRLFDPLDVPLQLGKIVVVMLHELVMPLQYLSREFSVLQPLLRPRKLLSDIDIKRVHFAFTSRQSPLLALDVRLRVCEHFRELLGQLGKLLLRPLVLALLLFLSLTLLDGVLRRMGNTEQPAGSPGKEEQSNCSYETGIFAQHRASIGQILKQPTIGNGRLSPLR